jgi:hypothetical protein
MLYSVLLELLGSFVVKISLSPTDLVFKPFLWTANFKDFFMIRGSHQTPAFHSFPSSHRNGTKICPYSFA